MPIPVFQYTKFICLLLFLTTVVSGTVGATVVAQNGDWEGYSETEAGQQVCYMGSEPRKAEGKYKKRGQTYMLVTHRPSEKSANVVSIASGYTYKKGSEITASIGKKKFILHPDGGNAFTADSKADNDLVKAMINGSTMIIRGISSRGTKTTDTYSLKGFTATIKAITKACKL